MVSGWSRGQLAPPRTRRSERCSAAIADRGAALRHILRHILGSFHLRRDVAGMISASAARHHDASNPRPQSMLQAARQRLEVSLLMTESVWAICDEAG